RPHHGGRGDGLGGERLVVRVVVGDGRTGEHVGPAHHAGEAGGEVGRRRSGGHASPQNVNARVSRGGRVTPTGRVGADGGGQPSRGRMSLSSPVEPRPTPVTWPRAPPVRPPMSPGPAA